MDNYDLRQLSTRVKNGVGWDRDLETAIFRAMKINIRTVQLRFTFLTRSIDAVEELRRRLLPQSAIAVRGTEVDGWVASMGRNRIRSRSETRARLAALLCAYSNASKKPSTTEEVDGK